MKGPVPTREIMKQRCDVLRLRGDYLRGPSLERAEAEAALKDERDRLDAERASMAAKLEAERIDAAKAAEEEKAGLVAKLAEQQRDSAAAQQAHAWAAPYGGCVEVC